LEAERQWRAALALLACRGDAVRTLQPVAHRLLQRMVARDAPAWVVLGQRGGVVRPVSSAISI
jgi:hypothetical protein